MLRIITAAALAAVLVLPPLSAPAETATAQTGWKKPPAGLAKSWQWQISGDRLDLGPAQRGQTNVYDIDYQFYSAADVAALKALGQYVVAYMDIGAWESYRPDAGQFPASVLGANTGWSGEKYLDIRPTALAQYKHILEARFDLARSKGFDAVEGDYQNNISDDTRSTFASKITLADQRAFNQWFVQAVHARGMAAILKNAPEYASYYASWPLAGTPYVQGYDGALSEQCWQYKECDGYRVFVQSGRPVWNAEYRGQKETICPKANALGLNTIRKTLDLTPKIVWACR